MDFTLLKNDKILIINSTVTIKVIESVKNSLGKFSISLLWLLNFFFIIVQHVSKFAFASPTYWTSQQVLHFSMSRNVLQSQFKVLFWILKISLDTSAVKAVVVLVQSRSKQVFSHIVQVSHSPQILVIWL